MAEMSKKQALLINVGAKLALIERYTGRTFTYRYRADYRSKHVIDSDNDAADYIICDKTLAGCVEKLGILIKGIEMMDTYHKDHY